MKLVFILSLLLIACSNSSWREIEIDRADIAVVIPIAMEIKEKYSKLPIGLDLTRVSSRKTEGYSLNIDVLIYPDAESAALGAQDQAPIQGTLIKKGEYKISGHQALLQIVERDSMALEFYKLIVDKRFIVIGFAYSIGQRPDAILDPILLGISIR